MDKDKIAVILDDDDEREQRIHELLKARKSLNINTEMNETSSFGERMSDKVAKFTGSWAFLAFFGSVVLGWAILNSTFVLRRPFDPFPYVFLNLVLGCIASIQAPIIMMSQNRESQKDRLRAENDYLVNLKSEIILEDLHMKVDALLAEQKKLKKKVNTYIINRGIEKHYTTKDGSVRSDLNGKVNTGSEESGIYDRNHRTH